MEAEACRGRPLAVPGPQLPEDGLGEAPSGVGCWRATRSSCCPNSSVLGVLREDRPMCPCLSVVPGPGGQLGLGLPVCWEMVLGAVPPRGPSPLALACLLGPCPPRALSARCWRPSSVGCSAAGGVSSVPHPPFPADRVVLFVLTAASRGRHCPRLSGDPGTQKLTCGLACGCGLSTVSFQWGAGMPPSASPVLQRGLGACCLRRPGPGGCDPQVAPRGACVLPLADCAPPAPWPGTRALGPSGQWRCVSVRLPVAAAPMPGSTCSRLSRAPPPAVCAVGCGQGQLCREHGRWAVLPRGREVERLSGEGPTPRLGACVAGQVGSWLAGRRLFRATCGGTGQVSSLLLAQSRGPLAPAAEPGCSSCPA